MQTPNASGTCPLEGPLETIEPAQLTITVGGGDEEERIDIHRLRMELDGVARRLGLQG